MARSFTAAEIADRIKRPGEEPRVTTDRIRNWTREGLLTTIGDKNPGTGRSRLYGKSAVVEAVLLQVFVDCLGVSAATAKPLLTHAKRRFAESAKAGELEGSILLISRSIAQTEFFVGMAPFADLSAMLAKAGPHDTHTIVDFDRLLPRLSLEID